MIKRIIGIDPGSYCTGYGIIDIYNNNIVYLTSGCIKVNYNNFFYRLKKINLYILDIFIKFKPNYLIIEKIFFYKNWNTTIRLSQLCGSIILSAYNNLLSIFEYSITQIRKSVFLKGNINKKYLNKIICDILKIKYKFNIHIIDALAAAITHYNFFYKKKKKL